MILLVIFLAFWAVAATIALALIFTGKVPFPDRGSTVLTCVDRRAQYNLVRILGEMGVSRPIGTADDSRVKRVIMDDLTVLNVTDPALLASLGGAGGGRIYPVGDPCATARRFEALVTASGYSATVHEEVDDAGTPVVLVVTNMLVNNVIGFRLPITQMPKPKPWPKA